MDDVDGPVIARAGEVLEGLADKWRALALLGGGLVVAIGLVAWWQSARSGAELETQGSVAPLVEALLAEDPERLDSALEEAEADLDDRSGSPGGRQLAMLEAVALERKDQPAEAADRYDRLVATGRPDDPFRVALRMALARSLEDAGRPGDAADVYLELEQQDASLGEIALLGAARTLEDSGRADEARSLLSARVEAGGQVSPYLTTRLLELGGPLTAEPAAASDVPVSSAAPVMPASAVPDAAGPADPGSRSTAAAEDDAAAVPPDAAREAASPPAAEHGPEAEAASSGSAADAVAPDDDRAPEPDLAAPPPADAPQLPPGSDSPPTRRRARSRDDRRS